MSAFGHLCVCVLVCVYGHICISLDDVAVNFFGVTENDLELLLLINVSVSGNGTTHVLVCVLLFVLWFRYVKVVQRVC